MPCLPLLAESQRSGFKFVVAPIETMLAAAQAIESLAETFLRDGSAAARKKEMMGFEELKEVLELEKYLRLREEEAPEK